MKKQYSRSRRPLMATAGLLAAALGAEGALAQDSGAGIKWTFDGELSQGLIWRKSDRNAKLVGPSNGGGASTDLDDDGNLNSRKGSLVSAPTSLLATLEGEAGRHRILLRGSAVYDDAVMDKWAHRGADSNPAALHDAVRDAVGRRARLLDAYYAYATPLDDGGNLEFKLGRQTILWGEAKFLGGGINMFNPIDAWKSHKAGVSLKEMVLPVGAAQVTWQPKPSLTLQGFYQLEKARFEYDPVGTFFSDVDLLGVGGGASTIAPFSPPLLRGADGPLKRSGQFGLAAFTKAGGVNLGFYFSNLNQRAAKISGRGINGATSYFQEWPEDVKTIGMSFSGGVGSASLSGEVGMRRGVPVGLDSQAVGAARAGASLCGPVLGGAPANCGVDFSRPPFNIPVPPLASTPLRADASGQVRGWTRVNQTFFNLGLTQAFSGSDLLPRVLGANGGALFLETSLVHSALPNQSVQPTQVKDRWHGAFFGQASLDYLRVAGTNITITPKLIVQTWFMGDDVSQAPFFKGRWSMTPAIQFRHEQTPDMTFEIAYTRLFDRGGRGAHVLSDRDFLAAQFKWAF